MRLMSVMLRSFSVVLWALALASVALPHVRSLTVHLVPHTHDDVGWLKTVDQYYYEHVQHILTSMVLALDRVPERKFTYVEQAYFQRWWRQQSPHMHNLTRHLVHTNRLEFANGGWCMHDEATTHYIDMIDQTTLGHHYIRSQFGEAANPTIGWQLDPFGHSATQAALLSAEAGFDALFFGRIDYQDHDLRVKNRELQFVWAPSPSLGPQASVYTEASLDGNYNPPDGLCWDPLCNPFGGGPDPYVQDRHDLEDYNVDERVDTFVRRALAMAAVHRGELATQHIMWLMGSDFMYEDAEIWFINLDKIIRAVNANGTVHARYSTPSEYVKARLAEGITYSVKTDDFFPYISDPQSSWTGYFTSRPGLKGYVRSSSVLLQVARQLEVLVGGGGGVAGNGTEPLWEALSVAQHHDAVTGTELDWVSDDYAMRIASGAVQAYATLDSAITQLAANHSDPNQQPIPFASCPLLNLTSCPPISRASSYSVILWNPLARPVRSAVRLPVYGLQAGEGVAVRDVSGAVVVSDVLPVVPTSASLLVHNESASNVVAFVARVPALGYTAYSITINQSSTNAASSDQHTNRHVLRDSELQTADTVSIENSGVELTFDTSSGLLTQWTDKTTSPPTSHSFRQNFYWYESSNTSAVGCSNPYYFKPQPGTELMPLVSTAPTLTVTRGTVVREVTQRWSSWLSQVVRLYTAGSTAGMVEFEWTVGPIDVSDGRSKEVVSKYFTDISSGGTFATDSNGREFQPRVRDQRPTWNWTNVSPVAGNYYPLSTAITMDDGTTGLAVLVDRAQGAASLQDGNVELMLHRRILYACGLSVPLNETGQDGRGLIITGTHRLFLGPIHSNSTRPSLLEHVRLQQQRQYYPLHPLFAASSSSIPPPLPQPTTFVSQPLPPHVELSTLQRLSDGRVLLRLAHSFAVNESDVYSRPVRVDLSTLFQQSITAVQRTTLTANAAYKPTSGAMQYAAAAAATEWEDEGGVGVAYREAVGASSDTVVTLGPMQIATFVIELQQDDQ